MTITAALPGWSVSNRSGLQATALNFTGTHYLVQFLVPFDKDGQVPASSERHISRLLLQPHIDSVPVLGKWARRIVLLRFSEFH